MGGLVVVSDPRLLAGDALHAEILRDNVHDARMDPSCGNWAAGVDKMYSSLGMQSPFLGPAGWVLSTHTPSS